MVEAHLRSMDQKKILIISLLLVLAGLIAFIAGLQFLFALVLLLLLLLFIYYFFHDDNEIHQEAMKRNVKNFLEEQEAHQWIEYTFAPRTNKLLKKRARKVSIIFGAVLLLLIFFWSYTISSLITASIITVVAGLIFSLILVYFHHAPKMFNHFPDLMKPYTQNAWVRGYIIFLPVVILLYLISPYANIFEQGIAVVISLPSVWFFYTVLFFSLFCLSYLYQQNQKDVDSKAKKAAREMLRE